jgi:DNA-binding transcriptional LysR family regulator
VVRINSETVFAAKWLVQNLHDFYEKHPGIEIELDATPDLVDIDRYEAEIAIRFFLNDQVDHGGVLLSNAPIYPHATPKIAEEIGGDPLKVLNYRLLRDRAGDPWGQWFALAGYPNVELPANAPKRIRALLANEAVSTGLGVLLASEDNVEMDLKAGKLVRVFDIGFRQGSYRMLFGEGVLRRKPVRLFRDWLLARTEKFRDAEI